MILYICDLYNTSNGRYLLKKRSPQFIALVTNCGLLKLCNSTTLYISAKNNYSSFFAEILFSSIR